MSRLISLRDNDGALSKIPNKTIYMSMDFNKIDNYRFHDPLLYPISAVERSKHLYLPQINNLSMILPPAPPLTQFKDIPQVHTWIFNKSDLINLGLSQAILKKNRLNCDLHKKVIIRKIFYRNYSAILTTSVVTVPQNTVSVCTLRKLD